MYASWDRRNFLFFFRKVTLIGLYVIKRGALWRAFTDSDRWTRILSIAKKTRRNACRYPLYTHINECISDVTLRCNITYSRVRRIISLKKTINMMIIRYMHAMVFLYCIYLRKPIYAIFMQNIEIIHGGRVANALACNAGCHGFAPNSGEFSEIYFLESIQAIRHRGT